MKYVFSYPPFGKGGVIFVQSEVKSGMRLVNESNGKELAADVKIADTFFSRFKGLMLTDSLSDGHSLYIQPCRSIHTFFMNYSIDVLYINENNEIVGTDEQLEPAKMGKRCKGAYSVFELPEGTIRNTGTKVGHSIKLIK
ncbi:DUF192 domain-containing protein [Mesobacillus sp.]|uniref:DUF192 domain-containing protein n=1 Tax=Mesobacillus sp. TaxID=2675271 RepID=UPI0039F053FC